MSREYECLRCGTIAESSGPPESAAYRFNTVQHNLLTYPWKENHWDGPAYQLTFDTLDEKTPYEFYLCGKCVGDLIECSFLKPHPVKICPSCKKGIADLRDDEGNDVKENGECHLGYGSTHVLDVWKFSLPAGWYCYGCLDKMVDEGNAVFVRQFDLGDTFDYVGVQREFLSDETCCTEEVLKEILDAVHLLSLVKDWQPPADVASLIRKLMFDDDDNVFVPHILLDETYFLIDSPPKMREIVVKMIDQRSHRAFRQNEFGRLDELLKHLRETGSSMQIWRDRARKALKMLLDDGFHISFNEARSFTIRGGGVDFHCSMFIDQKIDLSFYVDESDTLISVELDDLNGLREAVYEMMELDLYVTNCVASDVEWLLKSQGKITNLKTDN